MGGTWEKLKSCQTIICLATKYVAAFLPTLPPTYADTCEIKSNPIMAPTHTLVAEQLTDTHETWNHIACFTCHWAIKNKCNGIRENCFCRLHKHLSPGTGGCEPLIRCADETFTQQSLTLSQQPSRLSQQPSRLSQQPSKLFPTTLQTLTTTLQTSPTILQTLPTILQTFAYHTAVLSPPLICQLEHFFLTTTTYQNNAFWSHM